MLEEEEVSDVGSDPENLDFMDDSEKDGDPLDPQAIQGLMADFWNSLEQVFGYKALSAEVVQTSCH
jgi:hypothetical protein